MPDLPKSTTNPKKLAQPSSSSEQGEAGNGKPSTFPQFGTQDTVESGGKAKEVHANPFASPNGSGRETRWINRPQEEALDGWTFQGRRKHTPKLISPRPEAPHSLPRTPQRECTPGSKRGSVHSEIHPSFFTALGIPAPANKEPLRTRIWPVVSRVKNDRKEILVHSKNKALPSLPLSIRLSGPMEAEGTLWDPNSAWPELVQRIELELEEKVLRFKLSINERPQLEWVWHEEPNRGGIECTILAHVSTGESALSLQNKKHLHWKSLDDISNMNNEVEFAAAAHNLLKKADAGDTTRQAFSNKAASILASPQAARKKRYTKLDLTQTPLGAFGALAQEGKIDAERGQRLAQGEEAKHTGSLSQPAARSRLTYD
jgi:hypothetical protein